MTKTEKAEAVRAKLVPALESAGWEKGTTDRNNDCWSRICECHGISGGTYVVWLRVVLTKRMANVQILVNGDWFHRTGCALQDVMTHKGYSVIGSETIHH